MGLNLSASSSGLPPIPLSALELVGGLLITIGLPASYLKQRKEIGMVGLIGFILFWVSSFLVTVVLSAFAIFYTATTPPPVHPGAAVQIPAFFQYISSSGFFELIGALLYGAVTFRARVFPSSVGLLLLAAVFFALPQLIMSGLIVQMLGLLSTFLLPAGLARLGFTLARWPEYFDNDREEEKVHATFKDFIS